VTRSRDLILTAATRVFLERGYHGATVDQVAEAAGVAKRTVYNVYGEKDALFRATVLRSIDIADRFSATLAAQVHDVADPVAELPGVAVRLAEAVLNGPVLPLRRLLVMESATFPDLAVEYRRRAPDAVLRALAELFSQLSARGHLRAGDPDLMSEHFAFLVMGADLDRGMFAPRSMTPARIRKRALAGAEAFLHAYAVDPAANTAAAPRTARRRTGEKVRHVP
jgi:TetR/AcrR family transcriptional repressor of mexJK operon